MSITLLPTSLDEGVDTAGRVSVALTVMLLEDVLSITNKTHTCHCKNTGFTLCRARQYSDW